MDNWESAKELKSLIKQVANDVVKEKTRDCFRVFKATVVKPPYYDDSLGNVCQVKLNGDSTVLTLPYATTTKNMKINQFVWVATTSDSFRNAIVWETRFFQNEVYLTQSSMKHYGVRWDKTVAKMERIFDAESISADTTNFCYAGAVNEDYNNPFDNIYPWSGIRLCNVDIALYMSLESGQSIKDCVISWEGDPDFSYDHENGVWRYRPEFYGKSWEDDTYRYFDVCGTSVIGYVFYPEAIIGRWHGTTVTKTINGTQSTCLIPTLGIPANRASLVDLHQYAKNYQATLDSIYSIDADTLLYIVEFADMNSQRAIGNGVSALYRQSSDQILENVSNANVVKVNANVNCIVGAILDIGTTNGGNQVGSYVIQSVENSANNTLLLTLDQNVTVSTSDFWSIHGLSNQADEEIGSKSGYIGANGRSNVYYRGMVPFGNFRMAILGAYERGSDHHFCIAKNDFAADEYVIYDETAYIDTGFEIPRLSGYISGLQMFGNQILLSIPPVANQTDGNSTNPVGDSSANNQYSVNTILQVGGYYGGFSSVGIYYSLWNNTQTEKPHTMSARPRLKNP